MYDAGRTVVTPPLEPVPAPPPPQACRTHDQEAHGGEQPALPASRTDRGDAHADKERKEREAANPIETVTHLLDRQTLPGHIRSIGRSITRP